MPKPDQGLIDWIAEAMEPVGVVTWRPMMGGATLYCDGTVFAILADGLLWFKADKLCDAVWDAADCPRFTYEMRGKTGSMNYRRAPDAVYDDADTLRQWGALALDAGRRAPSKKAAGRKGSKPRP
jgi:DNA transformation protein and related proteins